MTRGGTTLLEQTIFNRTLPHPLSKIHTKIENGTRGGIYILNHYIFFLVLGVVVRVWSAAVGGEVGWVSWVLRVGQAGWPPWVMALGRSQRWGVRWILWHCCPPPPQITSLPPGKRVIITTKLRPAPIPLYYSSYSFSYHLFVLCGGNSLKPVYIISGKFESRLMRLVALCFLGRNFLVVEYLLPYANLLASLSGRVIEGGKLWIGSDRWYSEVMDSDKTVLSVNVWS